LWSGGVLLYWLGGGASAMIRILLALAAIVFSQFAVAQSTVCFSGTSQIASATSVAGAVASAVSIGYDPAVSCSLGQTPGGYELVDIRWGASCTSYITVVGQCHVSGPPPPTCSAGTSDSYTGSVVAYIQAGARAFCAGGCVYGMTSGWHNGTSGEATLSTQTGATCSSNGLPVPTGAACPSGQVMSGTGSCVVPPTNGVPVTAVTGDAAKSTVVNSTNSAGEPVTQTTTVTVTHSPVDRSVQTLTTVSETNQTTNVTTTTTTVQTETGESFCSRNPGSAACKTRIDETGIEAMKPPALDVAAKSQEAIDTVKGIGTTGGLLSLPWTFTLPNFGGPGCAEPVITLVARTFPIRWCDRLAYVRDFIGWASLLFASVYSWKRFSYGLA